MLLMGMVAMCCCRMATVGTSGMSVAELVQNVTACAGQVAAAVPGGADNLSRFYLKTADSLAIPIYTADSGLCFLNFVI